MKNGNQTFPKWISLNTITGEYYRRAPLVENDTLFSFILNSAWTTDPAGDSQQVVNLTVKPYVVTGVIF